MAHIVQLTAAQQAAVAPLKAAVISAQKAVRDAQHALDAHLASVVPAPAGKSKFAAKQRITVSDDGAALIVG
jgi:hypothetical protein